MMMTDARGKLGGQVFSKNKGGAYVRTKVTPANPQTADQTTARSLFASISTAWSALTSAQRTAWNQAVEEWKSTDIFGDLISPSGKELYQRLNNQLQTVGGSAMTSPPAKVALPDAPVTACAFNSATPSVTFTGQYTTTGTYFQVWATAPLSAGTTFVKNRLRAIYAVDCASIVANDIGTAYEAKFGSATAGDNIYFAIVYVGANGQASPRQTIKATVS